MCGIVGFIDKKRVLDPAQQRRFIEDMTTRLEHRGRDGRGVHLADNVALGHARLSILDVSENGAQPFVDPTGDVVLSYNGEIYNFRELNQRLGSRDALKTQCDTETLLSSYVERGIECVNDLKGMFAFSIHDARSNTLTLAVDRFSIKPLYYVDTPDWFAWSSEIKSLFVLSGIEPALDRGNVPEYLMFRHVAGPETLFQGIRKLLPAQLFQMNLGTGATTHRIYWKPQVQTNPTDLEGAVLEKFTRSVQDHLLADVPVGIQLSGGVDSSLVVALAAAEKKDLRTYSIGLAEDGWNEFAYSRQVAERYKTQHTELTFTEQDFCAALPMLTYHHDQPIGHSHSVPMYLLAKRARQDVKVLLSGEGADEVYGGYRRYRALFERRDALTDDDIVYSNTFLGPAEIADVLTPDVPREIGPYRRNVVERTALLGWFERISAYDLSTYLVPLLTRQDTMGMAANLENRVPFLDHEFVELGFSLPIEQKMDGTEEKILLKKVASQFLPHDLIYRKKCGFGQPIVQWLRNPEGLGAYLGLLGRCSAFQGLFNKRYLLQLKEQHLDGTHDHSHLLWALINLEIWGLIFLEGRDPAQLWHDVRSV